MFIYIKALLFTTNHKVIGISYLVSAILCGFLGYIYSLFIRLELSVTGCGVLFGDYQFYNVLITAHGLVMVFAFIMPVIMGGMGNYFLPVLLGAPDMVFPRLNNLSYWMFMLGFALLATGLLTEEGIGTGWTLYPTLICSDFHSSLACDFVMLAVHALGISSILNSINFLATCFCCKRKNFNATSWTLFIWGGMVTSALLITCLPVLAGGVTLILCDRNFNTSFYDVVGGGDLVLFQHLFWFFGHPEVYIIILPIFGLISTIIESIGFKSVFSSVAMIYSMLLIAILGYFVWAHHMFVIGMDIDTRAYFGSVTILIGLPTCIKLFNWFYSFLYSDISILVEVYFVYVFVFMFLLGGITGLLLANVGLDILLHDTYFVVAHFHYVLSLGATTGFFAAFIHLCYVWLPVELNYFWVVYFLAVFFVGTNMLFFPMHSLGLYAFPRRITDYPISFLYGSIYMLIGMLLLLCLVVVFSCLFCVMFFFDSCMFSSLSAISIAVFYNYMDWAPCAMAIYYLCVDFSHLLLDEVFIMLCFSFIYSFYFLESLNLLCYY